MKDQERQQQRRVFVESFRKELINFIWSSLFSGVAMCLESSIPITHIDHGLTLEWYCRSGVGNLSLSPGQKQTLQYRVGRTTFQPTIPFPSVFTMLLEFVNLQSFDQINTLFPQFITKAYNTTYSRFIGQCAFSQVVSQMYVARKAD